MNSNKAIKIIKRFIRDEVKKRRAKKIILGQSGGIDSTLTDHLCTETVGRNRVIAFMMPWGDKTLPSETEDGIRVAKNLGIEYEVKDISKIVKSMRSFMVRGEDDIDFVTLVQRMRSILLMSEAEQRGYIAAGTGNSVEWWTGFANYIGDGHFYPIADLFKTEVYALARKIGVPDFIMEKAPHSGFLGDATDEEVYGLSYRQLDNIIYMHVYERRKVKSIAKRLRLPEAKVEDIVGLLGDRNDHENEHWAIIRSGKGRRYAPLMRVPIIED